MELSFHSPICLEGVDGENYRVYSSVQIDENIFGDKQIVIRNIWQHYKHHSAKEAFGKYTGFECCCAEQYTGDQLLSISDRGMGLSPHRVAHTSSGTHYTPIQCVSASLPSRSNLPERNVLSSRSSVQFIRRDTCG
jgi:hypothetical protein